MFKSEKVKKNLFSAVLIETEIQTFSLFHPFTFLLFIYISICFVAGITIDHLIGH